MKTLKKLWMGLALALLAVLAISVGPRHTAAAGIVGFTKDELSASSGNSAFYFQDSKTIIGEIKHNGVVHKVAFIGPTTSPNADPAIHYPYTNTDGSFCQPPNSKLSSVGYSKSSGLSVVFSDTNPLTARIVSDGLNNSYLWPGPNAQSCGVPIGNTYNYPISVTQDQVSVKNNVASGPGSAYNQAVIKSAKYTFAQNAGLIQMSFPGSSIATVNFVDQQPYDSNYEFVSTSLFCNGSGSTKQAKLKLQPTSAGFGADSIPGQLTQISYFNGATCVTNNKDLGNNPFGISVTNADNKLADGTSAKLAQTFLQWNGDKIDVLKCDVSAASCSADFSLSAQPNSNGLTYLQSQTSACGDHTLALPSKDSYIGSFYDAGSVGLCTKDSTRVAAILNTQGTVAGQNGTAVSTGSSSCSVEDSLNWILCPIVTGLSDAANAMDGFVNGQLNFDVTSNLGGDSGQIHASWTIFKDLVSVLIVIVMLVMVISQAAGGAMFDAYTVKKVLPKLVVAVIAMQISWPLLIWIIGLANDAGQGIGGLITAPFGGLNNLDLPHLIQHLSAAYSITVGNFGGWIGVLLVPMAVWLFWPWLLIGAFLAFMAVIAAMATLLIRNALIILAVITAPLALLAWVLPNTNKFWKYWSSNFSKALMLFPLVMGMIYGGRIFGWVAGNLGSPGPLDLIMIFVGYFGPYFFLPKTFKWGGSILAGASRAVTESGAYKGVRSRGLSFGKEIDKQWRGKRTRTGPFRYNPNDPDKLRYRARRLGYRRDAQGNRIGRLPRFRSHEEFMKQRDDALKKAGVAFREDPKTGKQTPVTNKQGQYLDKAGNLIPGTREEQANALRAAGVAFRRSNVDGSQIPVSNKAGQFLDAEGRIVNQGRINEELAKLAGSGKFLTAQSVRAGVPLIPMWEGRAVGRLVSGKLMPTPRGRAQAIQFGAEYADDMNKLASIYAHRKFQEANDNGYTDGNGKVWKAGVAAAKQAVVDATGDESMDTRISKLAIDELLKTKSWPEVEGSVITQGPHKGKHVYELPNWESFIGENPEYYPEVQRNEYQWVPDIMQLTYRGRTNEERAILKRAGKRAGERLSDADRVIYAASIRMKPDMIAGQKEGFWKFSNEAIQKELDRGTDQGKETAADLAEVLAQKLEDMVHMDSAGTALLGQMNSGQVRRSIDRILGHLNEIRGTDLTFDSFINANQRVMRGEIVEMGIPRPAHRPSSQEAGDDGGDDEGPEPQPVTRQPDPSKPGSPGGAVPAPVFSPSRDVFPAEVPIAQAPSGTTGEARIEHGQVTAIQEAAEAMTEAAQQISGASREVRRSATAQARLARRLGPVVNRAANQPEPPDRREP